MCKYCNDYNVTPFIDTVSKLDNGEEAFRISVFCLGEYTGLCLSYGGAIIYESNTKINYCPMCGRKL